MSIPAQNPPPYSPPGFTPAQCYQPQPHGQHNPPPAGLYPQLSPPPQTSTVIIQTTRPTLVTVGSQPTHIQCPSCNAEVLTTVKHQATTRTHCWALIICLFFCWPCVCLPYCLDSCQNANHYCPNCNAYIGTYRN